jgi:hypothetical protein
MGRQKNGIILFELGQAQQLPPKPVFDFILLRQTLPDDVEGAVAVFRPFLRRRLA